MSLVDLSNVSETEFQLIPDGTYKFLLEGAEVKSTRAGDGEYIKVEFLCLDKAFAKRKVWTNFNIKNKSETAANIGKGHLKKLLRAGGKNDSELADISDLLGIVVKLKIGTEHRPPFDPQNTVKGFMPADMGDEPAF